MNQRLISEHAFDTARRCAGLVSNGMTEEQQRQVMEGFFEICKHGLEEYAIHADRMQKRLHPSSN